MAAEVAGQVEEAVNSSRLAGKSCNVLAGWNHSWMLSVCLTGEGSGTLVVWLSGSWNLAGISCNVLNFL